MFLTCVIISVLASFGLAILLVEKGDEWPVSSVKEKIKDVLTMYNDKFEDVLECSICLSFWTPLLIDIVLFLGCMIFAQKFYFLWPISGFITSGITWFIYELLFTATNVGNTKLWHGDNPPDN